MTIDASAPSNPSLQQELGAIKEMVASLLASGAASPAPRREPAGHDPLEAWYLRLLSSAVSRELADRIVGEVRRRTAGATPGENELRAAFQDCIASYIRTAEPVRLPEEDAPRPRAVAIVGATGVGKTTTIAKLAARARLTDNARVAIITCDTNRIGAIEQLRTYADIIGVPFRVAATVEEMRAARDGCPDSDLLLVDTPGLSPRDGAGIRDLASLLDAADLHEVHLALPASGSESALLGACRAFAPLRPSRLLFTKLDEAVTYGAILSVAAGACAELSYFTTGPRIPEQLELPDATRLAELIAAA
jgi:flagellar biosynthesis protein FlhF